MNEAQKGDGGRRKGGRPRLFNEPTVPLSFRVPQSFYDQLAVAAGRNDRQAVADAARKVLLLRLTP